MAPHGACTMFEVRSLKSVGGYSEDINAQDGWELWYKLFKRIGAVNVNVPVFYYRQHGGSLSRNRDRLLEARCKIFDRIASKQSGDYKLKSVGLISVREDYPDFKGVPYHLFGEQSLLEIAIIEACCSAELDMVVVASESQLVLDFAAQLEEQGKVPAHHRLKRQRKQLEEGKVPIRDFMLEAGDYFHKVRGVDPDIIVFLSIHAPLRRSNHIDSALNLIKVTEGDTVVSVEQEVEPVFSQGPHGLSMLNPGRFRNIALDGERLYKFNGSLLATWWDVLLSHDLFGSKIVHLEMTPRESLQIKTPEAQLVVPQPIEKE